MNPFLRFMGAGFQMGAIIALFAFLGTWTDAHWGWAPWGTAGLTLLGVVLAMVWIIREAQATK